MSWGKQKEVGKFIEKNDMMAERPYRIMDLVSEIGELVKDATKSTDYGLNEEEIKVKEDEVGDVIFSLLQVCNSLDIDVEEALEKSMDKYQERIVEKGDPLSK